MGEINWDGHPDLNPILKLVFLNLPAHREKSGKSRNVEISQLFPAFPSTNLGSYSQKSQQYRLSRYSKSWENPEIGKSRD